MTASSPSSCLIVALLCFQLLLNYNVHATTSVKNTASPTRCTSSSDCPVSQICMGMKLWKKTSVATLRLCQPGDKDESMSCICTNRPNSCPSSAVCKQGYLCLKGNQLDGISYCVHCNYKAALGLELAVDLFSPMENDDPSQNCVPSPSPNKQQDEEETDDDGGNNNISSSMTTGGHTLDACYNGHGGCNHPRICVKWTNESTFGNQCIQNVNDTNCYCAIPPVNRISSECSTSDDCLVGDRCVEFIKGGTEDHRNYCISCERFATTVVFRNIDDAVNNCQTTKQLKQTPNATLESDNDNGSSESDSGAGDSPQQSPGQASDDEVCIDVKSLSHLSEHELVYGNNHRRAMVLCDEFGSCATEGHMVEFKGSIMMMKTYCKRIVTSKCEKRIMWVNSMKMSRNRLFVPSKQTKHLRFTVFAARYKTSLEESLLSTIYSIGSLFV